MVVQTLNSRSSVSISETIDKYDNMMAVDRRTVIARSFSAHVANTICLLRFNYFFLVLWSIIFALSAYQCKVCFWLITTFWSTSPRNTLYWWVERWNLIHGCKSKSDVLLIHVPKQTSSTAFLLRVLLLWTSLACLIVTYATRKSHTKCKYMKMNSTDGLISPYYMIYTAHSWHVSSRFTTYCWIWRVVTLMIAIAAISIKANKPCVNQKSKESSFVQKRINMKT